MSGGADDGMSWGEPEYSTWERSLGYQMLKYIDNDQYGYTPTKDSESTLQNIHIHPIKDIHP